MTCGEANLVDFTTNFGYKSGDIIGLCVNNDASIRVNPNSNDFCDIFGSNKVSSLNGWILHYNSQKKHIIKLQNISTMKYLRITRNKVVDCGGGILFIFIEY